MSGVLIIYPAMTMFVLTFIVILVLGVSRAQAVRRKEMSIKFYRTYREGTQTDRLHILTRHLQNHFEVPPLFYVVILFYLTLDQVNGFSIFFAWAFVVMRGFHTYVHLGSNNVNYRFLAYGLSLLALFLLWANLFFVVLI